MSEELEKLVADYSAKYKHWRVLVDKEKAIRQEIIEEKGEDGKEPDNLRDLLDKEVEDSGLRQAQTDALVLVKEAERKLFNFNFDHCEDPELRAELEHLSQDYAARITWLKQFIEAYDKMQAAQGETVTEKEAETKKSSAKKSEEA